MEPLVDLLRGLIDSPRSLALFLGILLAFLVIGLILYIYLSFVFFYIGKKTKVSFPRVAMIPIIGPALISYSASRMHFWPWIGFLIFLIGFSVSAFLFLNLIIVIISLIGFGLFLFYLVAWNLRMFRILKRPYWWGFFVLIPFVYIVLVGISLRKPNYDDGMKGGRF